MVLEIQRARIRVEKAMCVFKTFFQSTCSLNKTWGHESQPVLCCSHPSSISINIWAPMNPEHPQLWRSRTIGRDFLSTGVYNKDYVQDQVRLWGRGRESGQFLQGEEDIKKPLGPGRTPELGPWRLHSQESACYELSESEPGHRTKSIM